MRRRTRRQFCEDAALALALSVTGTGCRSRSSLASGGDSGASGAAADSSLPEEYHGQPLSPAAIATLTAVCERILPRDEDPGAVDLGVPQYIVRMIETPDLEAVREMFWKIFPIMNKEAGKKFSGKVFADLAPTEQDAILDTWQNGKESRQKAFEILVTLTMEGAFGDPKYGGNTSGLGFKMIGFTPDAPLKKMTAMPGMPGMPGMPSSTPAPSSSPAHQDRQGASHP
jgi:hypothetical protein